MLANRFIRRDCLRQAPSANGRRQPTQVGRWAASCLPGLILLLSFGLAGGACSESQAPATTPVVEEDPVGVRLLFIGNSLTYSNDLPGMLQGMLLAADIGPVEIEILAFPNWGLEDHWASGEAQTQLAVGDFDLAILQQGPSATEGRPSLLDYSARYSALAVENGTNIAMYMVWPSKARSFDFDGVSDSYRTAADNIDALLFPAGEAWRAAWAVDGALALYDIDQFHPSLMGTYLAALTMYEQISGKPASTVPEKLVLPGGRIVPIDKLLQPLLHEAASKANEQFARPVESWPRTR